MSSTTADFTAADFTTAGRYWLVDGQSSIDLGRCDTADELAAAIAQVLDQGDDDTDWSGWTVSRDDSEDSND